MKRESAPARRAGWAACALALWAAAPDAAAGVYTHVDPVSGMIVLSNMEKAGRGALPAAGARRDQPTSAPAAFPRISVQRQRAMDGGLRAILEDELQSERRALAAAARAGGDVLARHAANVAALERELGALAGKPNNQPRR